MRLHVEEAAERLRKCEDEAKRNELWQALIPVVESWARRVAQNYPRLREDFVQDAPAKVCEKFRLFDPGLGTFRSWAKQVLRNDLKDRYKSMVRRDDATERARLNIAVDEKNASRPDGRELLEAHDVQPLSEEDLKRIEAWPPSKRAYLILICGNLWQAVPQERRSEWMSAAGLPDDFPPPDFENLDAVSERNQLLADAFGVSRNLLSQWLHRSKDLLRELDWLRERMK